MFKNKLRFCFLNPFFLTYSSYWKHTKKCTYSASAFRSVNDSQSFIFVAVISILRHGSYTNNKWQQLVVD